MPKPPPACQKARRLWRQKGDESPSTKGIYRYAWNKSARTTSRPPLRIAGLILFRDDVNAVVAARVWMARIAVVGGWLVFRAAGAGRERRTGEAHQRQQAYRCGPHVLLLALIAVPEPWHQRR